MSPRRYFIGVLAATMAMVAAAWLLAWWLEPLYGDLTRTGGYAERDFGSNAPMEEFRPQIVTFGPFERPADVLVIGDSFANLRPYQQWQNWLAVRTGWRIHTLDSNTVNLNALVWSAPYRLSPPKIVILNVVERDLLDEYANSSSACESSGAGAEVSRLERHPSFYTPPVFVRRPKFAGLNPGFVRVWAWRTASRELLGMDGTSVLKVKMAREDLFSSRIASELLVFRNDLRKARWRQSDLARIRCGIVELAVRVQSNGVTRFVTAIAPDKSTAYRPWLAFVSDLPESHLPKILDGFPVPDARLDQVLASAIGSGNMDVYMPSDTHWGATGQRLVADAILQMLISEGLSK